VILDAREPNGFGVLLESKVFVDGREISGVWYVDTVAKLVKTEHVFQDADERVLERLNEWWGSGRDLRRHVFATQDELLKLIPVGWEIEAEGERPLSRVIRGKIDLQPIEDDPPPFDTE
jgi:hypothetical protein